MPTELSATWMSNLSRRMRPYIRDTLPHCPKRRPANVIWQRPVIRAVAADLTAGRTGRRFVRVDDLGLGGIVFYEIDEELTWEDVFGGEQDDGKRGGMSVDEVMDRISVEVNYAPLYACTSFVTGQIMNAVFHNSDLRPEPTENGQGFSVSFKAFHSFDYGSACASETPSPILSCVSDDQLSDEEPGLFHDDGDSIYSLQPQTPDKVTFELDLTKCPDSPTRGSLMDSVLGALLVDFENENMLELP